MGDASIGLLINDEKKFLVSGRVGRYIGDRKEFQDHNTLILLSMNRPELKSLFR